MKRLPIWSQFVLVLLLTATSALAGVKYSYFAAHQCAVESPRTASVN